MLLSVDLEEGRDELRGQVFRLVVAALGGTLYDDHLGVDLLWLYEKWKADRHKGYVARLLTFIFTITFVHHEQF